MKKFLSIAILSLTLGLNSCSTDDSAATTNNIVVPDPNEPNELNYTLRIEVDRVMDYIRVDIKNDEGEILETDYVEDQWQSNVIINIGTNLTITMYSEGNYFSGYYKLLEGSGPIEIESQEVQETFQLFTANLNY